MRATSAPFPAILGLACALLCPAISRGAIIDFGIPLPVAVVGQPVALAVEITYEAGESSALFSYGVALLPGPGITALTALDVQAAPALDFDGISGPGAFTAVTSDLLGVKGTVNLSGSPISLYSGSLLATFYLQFDTPGDYPLRLDFFNTLGPTEDIFITGNGAVLDDHITYGSTILHVVVPEPGASALLLAAAVVISRRQRTHER